MRAAECSMTLLRFGTRSKNRLSHGATGIWISKRKIFETRLRLERISFARSGQKSIIVSTNDLFDCACGRRQTTGLRCAEPDREQFCRGSRVGCNTMTSQATRLPPQVFQFGVGRWALGVRRFPQLL